LKSVDQFHPWTGKGGSSQHLCVVGEFKELRMTGQLKIELDVVDTWRDVVEYTHGGVESQ
jgi:hypothetical protein